jgi:thiamine biosynthesis protein ThiS
MMNAETIEVFVNGEARSVEAGRSVASYLEALGLEPALIVVEHNRAIIDRAAYPSTQLQDGDVLELVHFVGGG